MSVKTVIVDQAPKRVLKAQEKEFGVVITQAPLVVGDHYEAVAYVGDTKVSVFARSAKMAWSELKEAVGKEGGKGKVAHAERKRTTDYTEDWKKIKGAKGEEATEETAEAEEAEAEAESEAEPETVQPAATGRGGGRRG